MIERLIGVALGVVEYFVNRPRKQNAKADTTARAAQARWELRKAARAAKHLDTGAKR